MDGSLLVSFLYGDGFLNNGRVSSSSSRRCVEDGRGEEGSLMGGHDAFLSAMTIVLRVIPLSQMNPAASNVLSKCSLSTT